MKFKFKDTKLQKSKNSKLILNKVLITKLNDDSLAEVNGGGISTYFTDPFFTHHDRCCTCTIETNCNCPE